MTNEDESVMHAIRSLELQAEMRGRAEGAAAERARLVAVVEAWRAMAERKRDRALSQHGYQRAATLDSEEYAYRNVLEAMGAAEGGEGT